jgi:multidrug resistance efflux pump
MYKADDLTEETEEIILKRARNAVEMARFMYETAKVNYDRAVNFELPRRDEQMKDTIAQADISWQGSRQTLPLTLKKEQIGFEKAKVARQRSAEKLEELMADRSAMVVKSPVDGVVYYGQCDRGKWSTAATMAKKLRLGGSITPNEVVMTVVQPRPIFVRATLAEKDLAKVRPSDACKIVPTGFPEVELDGIVDQISSVPIDSEKFDLRVTLAAAKAPASLVPGMACKIKFPLPEKKTEEAEDAQKKVEGKGKKKK